MQKFFYILFLLFLFVSCNKADVIVLMPKNILMGEEVIKKAHVKNALSIIQKSTKNRTGKTVSFSVNTVTESCDEITEKIKNRVQTLIQKSVFVVDLHCGPNFLDLYNQDIQPNTSNRVVITPFVTEDLITENLSHSFPILSTAVSPLYIHQTQAQFLENETEVALVKNNSPFLENLASMTEKTLKAYGIPHTVYNVPILTTSQSGNSPSTNAILNSSSSSIILECFAPTALRLLPTLLESGFRGKIILSHSLDSPSLIKKISDIRNSYNPPPHIYIPRIQTLSNPLTEEEFLTWKSKTFNNTKTRLTHIELYSALQLAFLLNTEKIMETELTNKYYPLALGAVYINPSFSLENVYKLEEIK